MRTPTRISHAVLSVWMTSASLLLARPGDPLQEIYPSDPSTYDDFGRSVAISGTTGIIGSPGDDDNGNTSGSAYLFDTATGQQLRKLLAADGQQVDVFGSAVAISGSRAIVGAPADDDLGNDAGSAYVFDVSTGAQLYKLLPSDGAAGDSFGISVAISGATALVGAVGHDGVPGPNSGAAYLFDLTTGLQVHKLAPTGGLANDQFGRSVALDGFTAVIGAYYRSKFGIGRGTVYVYDAITGSYLRELTPGTLDDKDYFGFAVAVDLPLAVATSMLDDDNGKDAGAAYVFDVTTGQTIAKLTPDDAEAGDRFGDSVAILNNKVVVGAGQNGDNGWLTGSAYVFDAWTGQQIDEPLCPDPNAEHRFGYTVAIGSDVVLVGAHHDDDNGKFSGSVYVYDTCPDTLTLGAAPAAVSAGDTLSLVTIGGAPALQNFLFVVGVNGIPTFTRVRVGNFDSQCRDAFFIVVPAGLAGLDVTFLSVGYTATGLQASNVELVQFQ